MVKSGESSGNKYFSEHNLLASVGGGRHDIPGQIIAPG